jgi:hypothetical protein
MKDPISQLESVLCDPNGKCCIHGSQADRDIVDDALSTLKRTTPKPRTIDLGKYAGTYGGTLPSAGPTRNKMKYFFLILSLFFYLLMVVVLLFILPIDVYKIYRALPSKSKWVRIRIACKVTWMAFTGAFLSGWSSIKKEWK